MANVEWRMGSSAAAVLLCNAASSRTSATVQHLPDEYFRLPVAAGARQRERERANERIPDQYRASNSIKFPFVQAQTALGGYPGRRSDSSFDDDGKRNKIVQKMVPNSSINKAILPTLFPGANVRLARRQFTFSTGLFFFSVAVFFATTLLRRRRRPRSTFEGPGWSLVFVFSGRVTASDRRRRRRSCR